MHETPKGYPVEVWPFERAGQPWFVARFPDIPCDQYGEGGTVDDALADATGKCVRWLQARRARWNERAAEARKSADLGEREAVVPGSLDEAIVRAMRPAPEPREPEFFIRPGAVSGFAPRPSHEARSPMEILRADYGLRSDHLSTALWIEGCALADRWRSQSSAAQADDMPKRYALSANQVLDRLTALGLVGADETPPHEKTVQEWRRIHAYAAAVSLIAIARCDQLEREAADRAAKRA